MATKRPAKKKRAAARKGIEVSLDLSSISATQEQIDRLKAHLENHLLTWVSADVKGKSLPAITFEEFSRLSPRASDE